MTIVTSTSQISAAWAVAARQPVPLHSRETVLQ